MKSWLGILLLGVSLNAFGHGGGEAEIEIGPTKGVTEVAKDKSFKLSPEAIKRLEITWAPINETAIRIPKTAIVNALSESNVFRFRDGWFKSVPFKVLSKGEQVTIQSPEIQKGDQIVRTGVGYLRMIASQLGEAEEEVAHSDEEGEHGENTDKHDHSAEGGEHHD
jgi:hypothetical protein